MKTRAPLRALREPRFERLRRHYGTVIVATQGISVFLPPMGVSLLVACSVGGVKPADVARPLWPYLALMLALTLVIAFLPGVVLFLPNLLGY